MVLLCFYFYILGVLLCNLLWGDQLVTKSRISNHTNKQISHMSVTLIGNKTYCVSIPPHCQNSQDTLQLKIIGKSHSTKIIKKGGGQRKMRTFRCSFSLCHNCANEF